MSCIILLVSLLSTLDNLRRRLDRALKNRDKVNARITKVVFIGPAGAGKSHLLSALVREDPGEYRNSTPCAKRAIRAIANMRALVGKDSQWKLLKSEEFESMIVKRIFKNVESTDAQVPDTGKAQPQVVDTQAVDDHAVDARVVDAQVSDAQIHDAQVVDAQAPINAEVVNTPVYDTQVVDAQATTSSSTAAQPRDFEELTERLSAREVATTHSLDDMHCLIFVDTGGQPQYHEVFRAFVRNASLNLVVIKMTDMLDQVASDEFYKDGQMICQFGAYNLTNRQLVTRLLQASQVSHSATNMCGQISKRPACFLVGTHQDKEHECSESCAAKNRMLTETLRPYRDVVHPKQARPSGATEWIFPVNARPPFTEDQERLLQDLRDCIMEHSLAKSPTVPLAMAWYALEIRMEMLRQKGQRVISLADCREIAQALSFPSPDDETGEDDLLLALEYFDELGLIIYIPDVLPNTVFIDPQLLLDMVSELIASCCRLRGDRKYRLPYSCSAKEIEEFRDKGVFSVTLLEKCFSTHYVGGCFTARNFLDLLTYLLIASPLDRTHTRYFMPCLLQSNTTSTQLSTVPNHTCFLVHLEECLFGLFCALVACMLSRQTKPHLSFSDERLEHFSRHCVAFEADDYGCTVTLVNNESSLCFEVYVDTSNLDSQELSELCSTLRGKLMEGIEEASSKHHYEVDYKYAFFCSSECTVSQPHVAHVMTGGRKTMCMQTKKKFPLTEKQKFWMQTSPGMTAMFTVELVIL